MLSMLDKLKQILNMVLDEATLSQTINQVGKDRIIKNAYKYVSLEDILWSVRLEISPECVESIIKEFRVRYPKEELDIPENPDYEDINIINILQDNGMSFEDMTKLPSFKGAVLEAESDYFDTVVAELQDDLEYSKDGKIKLFRSIGLTPDNKAVKRGSELSKDSSKESIDKYLLHLEKEGKHLGIFWAESFSKAREFGNSNQDGNLYIIETEVDERHIDWEATIELRMHPYMGDEREIRLFKNTPLKIISITPNSYSTFDKVIREPEGNSESVIGRVFYS